MSQEKPLENGLPRRSDAVANRKRLIDAARDAFGAIGASAEVKDIAERAGVGVGTVYRHFANKEELLHAVIMEAVVEFERDLEDGRKLGDPVEALRHHLAMLLRATDSYGWLVDAILRGDVPQQTTDAVGDAGADALLQETIRRGIEVGAFRSELNVGVAADMLLGLVVTWRYGRRRESVASADVVSAAMDIFLQGALAAPAGPGAQSAL